VRYFTGRGVELARLTELSAGTDDGSACTIAVIVGMAGVGKTALAVHWGHQQAERFPDGQLYMRLRGFDASDQPVDPSDALGGLLGALGVDPVRTPTDLLGRQGLFRTLLAARRMLVVLDDARDAEQVRPLLTGSPHSLVLITSRHQLTGLVAVDGAQPLTLGLLSDAEAQQLLVARLGDGLADEGSRGAVDVIVRACAGLPLALTISAARALLRPEGGLAELAAQLSAGGDRLDSFDAGERRAAVRTVMAASYRYLGPEAACLFRLFGGQPGAALTVDAAASLCGWPVRSTRALLGELVRSHLVRQTADDHFTMHDLVAEYARERAALDDPLDERRVALDRLFQHYVLSAEAASLELEPFRFRIDMPTPLPGVTVTTPCDRSAAIGWFEAEHQAVQAATRACAVDGWPAYAWRLALALSQFLEIRGLWPENAAIETIALEAAETVQDPIGRAISHRYLGRALLRLRRDTEAFDQLEQARDLFTSVGLATAAAATELDLVRLFETRHQYGRALEGAQAALALFNCAEDIRGRAKALNSIAWFAGLAGQHQTAIDAATSALALFVQVGDRRGQADTWDTLGVAHQATLNHEAARDSFQRAVALFRKLDDQSDQAVVLRRLGASHCKAGDVAAAEAAWRAAAELLRALDDPNFTQVDADLRRLRAGRSTDVGTA
jgi:tetratricopeptide (TPR) repeat protein